MSQDEAPERRSADMWLGALASAIAGSAAIATAAFLLGLLNGLVQWAF